MLKYLWRIWQFWYLIQCYFHKLQIDELVNKIKNDIDDNYIKSFLNKHNKQFINHSLFFHNALL